MAKIQEQLQDPNANKWEKTYLEKEYRRLRKFNKNHPKAGNPRRYIAIDNIG